MVTYPHVTVYFAVKVVRVYGSERDERDFFLSWVSFIFKIDEQMRWHNAEQSHVQL